MSEYTRPTGARPLADRAAHQFPVRVLRKFLGHSGGTQAVVIAWNGLTAVFPIALALAAVGGFVLSAVGLPSESIAERMGSFFPSDLGTQRAVLEGMDSLRQQSGLFAVLALLGFVWTGSGLFGAMEQVFGTVLVTAARPFLRQKLMAVAMMGVFVVLALIGVGTSALLPLLNQIPGLPFSFTSGVTARIVQVGIGLLSGFVLFLTIYWIVPNRRQRLRRVLPAAAFAGVAFEVLTLLWPAYIALNQAGINRFGSQFAFLFVLLTFFYLLGVITVLGADVIAVLDEHRPPRAVGHAPRVEPTPAPAGMGRVRRTALGAAALLIGLVAGRRGRA